MNGAYASQILSDKLTKLNNSQQSIETLSHWCIFHRKKAKQVVETWGKEFVAASKDQQVPLLYLANDILQNSRRKGLEFVNEFWNVLPASLKGAVESGDENVRTTIFRLIDIWEDRKVFGARGQSLKEELLEKDAPSSLENHGKRLRSSIRIKRDGGILEKVATAYLAVHEGVPEEESTLAECSIAISRVESLGREAGGQIGNGTDPAIADELQQQQMLISQCIELLEATEANRTKLASLFKEALHDQERKLVHIRTQLQKAQAQASHAGALRQRLLTGGSRLGELASSSQSGPEFSLSRQTTVSLHEHRSALENGGPRSAFVGSLMSTEPMFGSMVAVDTQSNKRKDAAAEVAAKLAASTSSAAMLTSVLSSLAAEEVAASYSNSLPLQSSRVEYFSGPPLQEKRHRLDSTADVMLNSDASSSYMQHHPAAPHPQVGLQLQQTAPNHLTTMHHQPPPMQHQAHIQHQASSVQPQSTPPVPQYMGYRYSGGPAPLPLQSPRVSMPPQPYPPGFVPAPYQPPQPPGMGFYGQPPLPPTPVPRQ
ncbi:hypothetical protein O6H91_02G116400 [Diphasiastrum complanatum]|uniref:Uncharacterized protein n=9 Tax=Diphasiastrum complanatum TaxID=34168 RepID=A0ACC2EJV4_DIPCM|nr:hypothetical protein O6H91_02G116400 [Diphasiastrum complanatum]KAJ7566731.1 hypothetical protein O6H91_02G116400 [Diphasiastrum complanatum]KAJ7566732.1 hypothetical protein O6H91_02G116400 [Diphasiastrum complanatum]KAJ7566733.1 hypothetical protein O6H91_02G116400 [Diphasiastrum complanatum]KAJ7566734.1 hypothetical protein O6H91_02G116400 [Diphasiastrum complanatum]